MIISLSLKERLNWISQLFFIILPILDKVFDWEKLLSRGIWAVIETPFAVFKSFSKTSIISSIPSSILKFLTYPITAPSNLDISSIVLFDKFTLSFFSVKPSI